MCRNYLEKQDANYVWPPYDMELRHDGRCPGGPVLSHLKPSDTNQSFDSIAKASSRARRNWLERAVVDPEITLILPRCLHGCAYVSSIKNVIMKTTTTEYRQPVPYAHLQFSRATRKPKAKGDMKGDTRKPMVQMLS